MPCVGPTSPPAPVGARPPGTADPAEPAGPPSLPIAAYPLELLGLLAPRAQRGPVTLTPATAVSEEYNDNIRNDNQHRQWDFITSYGPDVTLFVHRPSYDLIAGYSFSGVVYAREDSLNKVFDRHNFIASGLYRLTPGLTLTASDVFAYDHNSNRVASQGLSTGRQTSWSNTFTPGMNWQVTPLNSLGLTPTYSVLRFDGAGAGKDSDTYAVQSNFTHAFTPRFSGIIWLWLHVRGSSTGAQLDDPHPDRWFQLCADADTLGYRHWWRLRDPAQWGHVRVAGWKRESRSDVFVWLGQSAIQSGRQRGGRVRRDDQHPECLGRTDAFYAAARVVRRAQPRVHLLRISELTAGGPGRRLGSHTDPRGDLSDQPVHVPVRRLHVLPTAAGSIGVDQDREHRRDKGRNRTPVLAAPFSAVPPRARKPFDRRPNRSRLARTDLGV